LSHLPAPSKHATERRDSPVAEFGPIAEKALPLVADSSWELLQRARAVLLAEAPWASEAIEILLRDLVGRPFLQLRPTLLLGQAGTGKSRLAHRLATLVGLPVTIYSAAGVADGAFGGTPRQWSTGRASVPLQAIRRAMVANPVIVIDEIEKAGTRGLGS
jgi:hypothetical protein